MLLFKKLLPITTLFIFLINSVQAEIIESNKDIVNLHSSALNSSAVKLLTMINAPKKNIGAVNNNNQIRPRFTTSTKINASNKGSKQTNLIAIKSNAKPVELLSATANTTQPLINLKNTQMASISADALLQQHIDDKIIILIRDNKSLLSHFMRKYSTN